MGSEHRTSCYRLPNFARQKWCGAGTDHMTPVKYMNIIHIELMLLKKLKCVKKIVWHQFNHNFGHQYKKNLKSYCPKKCSTLLTPTGGTS